MVGDGSCLLVTAVGSAPCSFRLPNVLVAPQMVHNLLSIRQFTADNSCFIKFDSFGLTVKDSASRRPLLRWTSRGPFTPFAFFLPLHYSRLLLRPGRLGLPLLPRHRLPPSGTAVLVTIAATFWISSVVVPMFLVLGLLLSPSAMRASSVVMFGSLFLLLRMRRMHLIACI